MATPGREIGKITDINLQEWAELQRRFGSTYTYIALSTRGSIYLSMYEEDAKNHGTIVSADIIANRILDLSQASSPTASSPKNQQVPEPSKESSEKQPPTFPQGHPPIPPRKPPVGVSPRPESVKITTPERTAGNIKNITSVEWNAFQKVVGPKYQHVAIDSSGLIHLAIDKQALEQYGSILTVYQVAEKILERGKAPENNFNLPKKLPTDKPNKTKTKSSKSTSYKNSPKNAPKSSQPPAAEQLFISRREMISALELSKKYRKNFSDLTMESLEKSFSLLDQKFNTYFSLKNKASKQPDADLEEKIADIKLELQEEIEALTESYPSMKDAFAPLYQLYNDQTRLFLNSPKPPVVDDFVTYLFYKEAILARKANHLIYVNEIEKNIKDNLPLICEELFHSHFDGDMSTVDLLPGNFKNETHHRGKVTVPVLLMQNNQVLGTVIYKPRDALIDQKVIALFEKINELKIEPLLPTYKILSLNAHASVWELVGGKEASKFHLGTTPPSVAQIITHMEINATNKDKLLNQLNKIDKILTEIQIADMHAENLMIAGEEGENPRLVPIDLENRQWGTPNFATFLDGEIRKVSLSGEERKLIEEFNASAAKTPSRFIIIGSQRLQYQLVVHLLSSIRNAPQTSQRILQQLQRFGFELLVNVEKINRHVLVDILNGDVPYFSELENVVYYGSVASDIPIARRKSKEGI